MNSTPSRFLNRERNFRICPVTGSGALLTSMVVSAADVKPLLSALSRTALRGAL